MEKKRLQLSQRIQSRCLLFRPGLFSNTSQFYNWIL